MWSYVGFSHFPPLPICVLMILSFGKVWLHLILLATSSLTWHKCVTSRSQCVMVTNPAPRANLAGSKLWSPQNVHVTSGTLHSLLHSDFLFVPQFFWLWKHDCAMVILFQGVTKMCFAVVSRCEEAAWIPPKHCFCPSAVLSSSCRVRRWWGWYLV